MQHPRYKEKYDSSLCSDILLLCWDDNFFSILLHPFQHTLFTVRFRNEACQEGSFILMLGFPHSRFMLLCRFLSRKTFFLVFFFAPADRYLIFTSYTTPAFRLILLCCFVYFVLPTQKLPYRISPFSDFGIFEKNCSPPQMYLRFFFVEQGERLWNRFFVEIQGVSAFCSICSSRIKFLFNPIPVCPQQFLSRYEFFSLQFLGHPTSIS